MEIRFTLLGPVQVLRYGHLNGPSSPSQRALLASLLLQPNRPVTPERLASDLWERPPASWRANLRTHITALRRALDDERLTWSCGAYLLRVSPGELDSDDFQRFRAIGLSEIAAGNLAAGAAQLEQALDQWQGSISLRGGILGARLAALERDRLHTFEVLTQARIRLGEHGSLIGELQALLADHPMHEGLWGQLIRVTYLAGDVATALATFDRARTRLAEDLGVDPSRELRRLHHAILCRDDAEVLAI